MAHPSEDRGFTAESGRTSKIERSAANAVQAIVGGVVAIGISAGAVIWLAVTDTKVPETIQKVVGVGCGSHPEQIGQEAAASLEPTFLRKRTEQSLYHSLCEQQTARVPRDANRDRSP